MKRDCIVLRERDAARVQFCCDSTTMSSSEHSRDETEQTMRDELRTSSSIRDKRIGHRMEDKNRRKQAVFCGFDV